MKQNLIFEPISTNRYSSQQDLGIYNDFAKYTNILLYCQWVTIRYSRKKCWEFLGQKIVIWVFLNKIELICSCLFSCQTISRKCIKMYPIVTWYYAKGVKIFMKSHLHAIQATVFKIAHRTVMFDRNLKEQNIW